jgi:hypothetical protein
MESFNWTKEAAMSTETETSTEESLTDIHKHLQAIEDLTKILQTGQIEKSQADVLEDYIVELRCALRTRNTSATKFKITETYRIPEIPENPTGFLNKFLGKSRN